MIEDNIENECGNVPRKVLEIETKLTRTPFKGFQTPVKSFCNDENNDQQTPVSEVPISFQSCSTPSFSSPGSISTVGSMAREAARISKLQNTVERVNKVAELKEKWAEEKKAKLHMSATKRSQELKKLHDNSSVAADKRKKNLEQQRLFAERQKKEKQELLASSLEASKQLAIDLAVQAKAKRRISVFLNKKIKSKALAKEKELNNEKSQQEVDLLAARALDFEAVRLAKIAEKQRKRESMVGRGVAANKQKEIGEQLQRETVEKEKDLFATRALDFEAVRLAKAAEKQRKRESMIGRNESASKQKEIADQLQREAAAREKDLLAAKRDDHFAVREANVKEDMRKRESMAARTQTARVHKEVEEKLQKEAMDEEKSLLDARHMNWQDDAEQKTLAAQRKRESMAGRNVAAHKQKEIADKLRQTAREVEADRVFSVRHMNWTDDKEARDAAEKRKRESLAFRLEKWRQHKDVQKVEEQTEAERRKDLVETRHEDWKLLEEYKMKQSKAARESLAFRLDKWREEKDRDIEEQERVAAITKDLAESHATDLASMQEYKLELRKAARDSLRGRLEKAFADRELEERLRAEEAIAAAEYAEIVASDYRDVKEYEAALRQKARESMEGRTLKAKKDREVTERLHRAAADAARDEAESLHEDYVLAREYNESLRQTQRASLAGRTEKAKLDRTVEEILEAKARQEAEEDAKWKGADRARLEQHIEKENNARRQSLENSRYKAMTDRDAEQRAKKAAQEQAAQDFELKTEDWMNVRAHKEAERKAARESLAASLASEFAQRTADMERHSAMLTTMHQDLELRRQDWQLLNEHKKADKDRRRRSMMLRTESAREQRMAEEKLRARKALEAEQDAYLRAQDHQAVLTHKREEEAFQRADVLNSSMVL